MRKLMIVAAIVVLSAPARAADTLADAGIIVSPELQAMGIDPGEYHPVAGQTWHPQPVPRPQIVPANLPSVWIMGDSIMAQLGRWGDIGNVAVPGRQTGDFPGELAHIPTGTARVIYVEGGINDYIHGTPANITANYQRLVSSLPASVQVRAIGILPVNEPELAPASAARVSNATIEGEMRQITTACAASSACRMVPQPFGKSLPASMSDGGGVHLSPAGITTMRAAIR